MASIALARRCRNDGGNGFSLPPPASLDAPYRSNGRAPAVSATPPASIGPGFGRSSNGTGFSLPPPPAPENGDGP